MKLKVTGRVWIETPRGTFAGAGRVALLERIKDFGSITLAAKSMKMSYRQAWEQIDAMNKQTDKPLVIKVSGGAGGGGSVLTDEGEKVIKMYKKLTKSFDAFVKTESNKI